MHIREIRKERSGGNTFVVYYVNNWGDNAQAEVFAKDELEAFTEFQKIHKKGEERMRTFFLCLTVVILTILTSMTYSCVDIRARYQANMATCVGAGKSYVSEKSGYSCRDPFVKATD
jgi:hypothetical protein